MQAQASQNEERGGDGTQKADQLRGISEVFACVSMQPLTCAPSFWPHFSVGAFVPISTPLGRGSLPWHQAVCIRFES